jgi:hypothetical protein
MFFYSGFAEKGIYLLKRDKSMMSLLFLETAYRENKKRTKIREKIPNKCSFVSPSLNNDSNLSYRNEFHVKLHSLSPKASIEASKSPRSLSFLTGLLAAQPYKFVIFSFLRPY